jgi:uncharacterized OB-fold protein
MSDQKNLRVFCPIHEASFEVADTPKIFCEITGHTLSSDFPNAEFWEFCCNCDTFSPSKLGKGENARSTCFSCQNDISKRFICTSCKTVSFAGEKSSKGQVYFISAEGIGPSCPGCGTLAQKTLLHNCSDAGAEFLTARETCPFCLEKTSVGFILPDKQRVGAANDSCPNCHAVNPPSALFCGKCRERLRFDVEVANPGTDVSRTQLLGSLCPNCSTPVIPGFPFCGECGQAVKTPAAAAPPPPPPPPSPESITRDYSSTDLSGTPGSEPGMNRIALVVGGLVVLALVIIVGVSIGGRSSSSGNNSSLSTPRPTPMISGTPNTSKGDSRIGKIGRLSTDMNLRAYPGATDSNPKIGTHYRNARVRILDVESVKDSKGNMYDWFKIQVTEYGQSADPNFAGQSKDPGSPDVGWIHSYPNVSLNSTEERKYSVNFDK